MNPNTIYVRASRAEAVRRVRLAAAIAAGRAPDSHGIANGVGLRVAVAFFSKVKQAFIVKSRGGTDEAGISWPPLSKEYLAYGRRFGPGEQAELKRAAGLGRGNRLAPGGKKGLLNAAQLKRWRQVYAQNLAWLASREDIGTAKAKAAAIAWNVLKREGAQTKLQVYGSRQVEILRDTGILFNSLSPGQLSTSDASASYTPPDGQICEVVPGEVVLGTNVEYAKYHHHGNGKRSRKLWPDADQIPESWWQDMAEQAAGGLRAAIVAIIGGRAA